MGNLKTTMQDYIQSIHPYIHNIKHFEVTQRLLMPNHEDNGLLVVVVVVFIVV